jgi:hypothetical protein
MGIIIIRFLHGRKISLVLDYLYPYKNGRGKRYTFETTEHINGLLVEREMLTTLLWSSIRGLAQTASLASSNECQSCK